MAEINKINEDGNEILNYCVETKFWIQETFFHSFFKTRLEKMFTLKEKSYNLNNNFNCVKLLFCCQATKRKRLQRVNYGNKSGPK